MRLRIILAIFVLLSSIYTVSSELCMQGTFPILLGGNKGSTIIHQIAYFETTGKIAAGGDTTSTDIFNSSQIILEAPYLALYFENSTDSPLWSKALLFSSSSPGQSLSGVIFNTNGNYIVAHAFNSVSTDTT